MMQVQLERNLKTTGKTLGPWDRSEIQRRKLPGWGSHWEKATGKLKLEVEELRIQLCQLLAKWGFKALSVKRIREYH